MQERNNARAAPVSCRARLPLIAAETGAEDVECVTLAESRNKSNEIIAFEFVNADQHVIFRFVSSFCITSMVTFMITCTLAFTFTVTFVFTYDLTLMLASLSLYLGFASCSCLCYGLWYVYIHTHVCNYMYLLRLCLRLRPHIHLMCVHAHTRMDMTKLNSLRNKV